MDINQIRADFPVLTNFTYLNTASSGILSSNILAYRREYDEKFLESGSNFRNKIIEESWETKKVIGRVFGCDPERIGLIPNFSWGINAVAEGLTHKKRVLLYKDDYPSLNLPFETRGYDCHYLTSEEMSMEGISAAIEKNKPDILAVSVVQWTDGKYLHPEVMKELKNKYPDLLVIADGTQYLGISPFNFDEVGIDAMITSGYKWLLAGYGNGFAQVSERLIAEMDFKVMGNNTAMERFLSKRENFGQRFEPGHIDMLNFGTLKRSIELLETTGLENIEKQIQKLALTLKTSLVNMGFISAKNLGGKYHSGILLMPGTFDLVKQLYKQNILTSMREGVRISFHFYNTKEDIQRLIQALKLIV